MANYKRKKSRTIGCGHYSSHGLEHRLDDLGMPRHARHSSSWRWTNSYPRYWDKLFHTRPARRTVKAQEGRVLRGWDADDMTWPDGRKPHIYYW